MEPSEPGIPAALHGLLRVARLARTADIPSLLRITTEVISESLGFRTVVVNLYRPAHDDLETVWVHGCDAARETLLGNETSLSSWSPLIDERFNRRGAYHLIHGDFAWEATVLSYVPDTEPSAGPDAWHPEDALFVPMRNSAGDVLGMLSVDEPASGQRPTETDLDVLVLAVGHVAAAIEQAQSNAAAAAHQTAVAHLLRVSTGLNAGRSVGEVLTTVCEGISGALEFEKVAVFLTDDNGGDKLTARAAVGWTGGVPMQGITVSSVQGVLSPEHHQEGCALVDRRTAHAVSPPELHGLYASVRNGTGPHAWDHHWLLVPLHDAVGRLAGVIWVDDPADRLLPTRERLQALRLFADQAVGALEAARRLHRLDRQAHRDPLTDLPNRRALDAFLDAQLRDDAPLSLLVCDLDNFKRVNDRLGHEGGDSALVRFAGLLSQVAGDDALASRLGGEEFALVLPGADEHAAYLRAEALRRAMAEHFESFPCPLSVSVGIAATGRHGRTGRDLLRNGDRALYAAKRLGRDRAVVYRPETTDELLNAFGAPSAEAGEQLAAVLLLAEMLDLRDDATAEHSVSVGRYAELTAAELGLDAVRVARIRVAGILHDIGKVGVADAILHKPGPLNDHEWAEMRRHAELGARILANANLPDVSSWVLAHHERIDGMGYPQQLAGPQIVLESRILAVADAFEAMTADRPYRLAMPREAGMAELRACAGSQFDPTVVEAFLRALEREESRLDAEKLAA